jgi:hypothetical protein
MDFAAIVVDLGGVLGCALRSSSLLLCMGFYNLF